MKNIYICIPTYNEAENIIGIIKKIELEALKITKFKLNILIIDDNSPDGTAKLVQEYIESKNLDKNYLLSIEIINNLEKKGLGKAYIDGFKFALSKNAYAICEMDADFSHDPIYLTTMINQLDNFDFIIGSRYVKNGGTTNWSLKRKLISRFGNFYSKVILGLNINDLTGGYNLYKDYVLKKIDMNSIKSNGYSFQIELKYRAFKANYKYCEIPIIFKDRVLGQSKLNDKIIKEAIFTPWKLRFNSFF